MPRKKNVQRRSLPRSAPEKKDHPMYHRNEMPVTHRVSSREEAEDTAMRLRREGYAATPMSDFDGSWHIEVDSKQISESRFGQFVDHYRSANPSYPPGHTRFNKRPERDDLIFLFQGFYESIERELTTAFEAAEKGNADILISRLRWISEECKKNIIYIRGY
jgi:hypothetical protein